MPKRYRHFSAEERQVHAAIEKQRREEFNAMLQQLAGEIPSQRHLAPSQLFKSAVVSESYKHIVALQAQLDSLAQQLESVTRQRDDALL